MPRPVFLLLVGFIAGLLLVVPAALATEESPEATDTAEDSGEDRLLAEGRVVFEANCVACHQADGRGVAGVFPPLLDNPSVDDTDYLVEVIRNGLSGEITVGGAVYDGAMPAFAALDDEQVDSLVAYVQRGLGAPTPPPIDNAGSGVPARGLPFATVLAYTAGFGIFAIGLAAVAGPAALTRRRLGSFSTAQVWLKSLAIFLYFVIATVFIPSLVVESRFLASPPSVYENLFSGETWTLVRDLIGSAVWAGALFLGFWALRRAQREDVI